MGCKNQNIQAPIIAMMSNAHVVTYSEAPDMQLEMIVAPLMIDDKNFPPPPETLIIPADMLISPEIALNDDIGGSNVANIMKGNISTSVRLEHDAKTTPV